jgi:probable HAF family extracellular repeat protein
MRTKTFACMVAITLFAIAAIPIRILGQAHNSYTITDLGTLGGTFTGAQGINNKGWVAGGSQIADNTEFHAVLWRKGEIVDLGTLGGPVSSATDRISESGYISGFSVTNIPDTIEGGLIGRAFLWRNGVMTALPSFNNAGGAEVNNRGQVASSETYATRAPSGDNRASRSTNAALSSGLGESPVVESSQTSMSFGAKTFASSHRPSRDQSVGSHRDEGHGIGLRSPVPSELPMVSVGCAGGPML